MLLKLTFISFLSICLLAQYCPPSDVLLETNITHVKSFCKSTNQVLFDGIPITKFYDPNLLGGLLKGTFKNMMDDFLEEKVRGDSSLFGPNPIIYHNIYDPYQSQVFIKVGNPAEWDAVSYHPGNPWSGAPLISIGRPVDNNDNGIQINVPGNYKLVWLRIHNQVLYNFKVIRPSDRKTLGIYGSGLRRSNSFGPDGSLSDRTHGEHVWIALPTFNLDKIIVAPHTTGTNGQNWISGLAFTYNPNDFITNSGNIYTSAVNGGNPVTWNDPWGNDVLSYVKAFESKIIKIPIIPTKRNKLIYLVEHNDAWTYNLGDVVVLSSGRKTRFKYTYQNAFQTHFDGKTWNRLAAFELFADEVPNDNFVEILINNRYSASGFYFREAGSFNYYRKFSDF